MCEPAASADDYWNHLLRESGAGREGYAFLGPRYIRQTVRSFDDLAGSGVLESLLGGSHAVDMTLVGRIETRDTRPRWFHLDISPVFNTWEARYEDGRFDANLGREGMVSGDERSDGPMPRSYIQHPSSLVYFDSFPMWGGNRYVDENLLPGSVDVLWQESAPISDSDPQWVADTRPGGLARIHLTCPDIPEVSGTAVFDLNRRLCLLYETRYRGETDFRMSVDAIRTDTGPWSDVSETGIGVLDL